MKIKFNQIGAVIETDTTDEALRQGNKGVNHLFAFFQGIENANYDAYITYERADGSKVDSLSMQPDGVDQTKYNYTFEDAWFFELYGTTKATVKLVSANGTIAMSGVIQFNIEQTIDDPEPSITPDEYEALLTAIALKLDKVKGIMAVASISGLDLSTYANGQLLLALDTQKKWKVKTVDDVKTLEEFYFSDYLKLTGGTMAGDIDLSNNKLKSGLKHIKFTNDGFVINSGNTEYTFKDSGVVPNNHNSVDIGSQSNSYKDIYFVGYLKSGAKYLKLNQIIDTVSNGQIINSSKFFYVIPQTQAGRIYNNDRQLTDKEYVDTSLDSLKTTLELEIEDVASEHTTINNRIDNIEAKIPSQASATNQLADKDWTNSTIQTLVAYWLVKNTNDDNFETVAELTSATHFYNAGVERTPTRNDYAFVRVDENHNNATTRYVYQGVYGVDGRWVFQVLVNETAFTEAQLKAINSGITDVLRAQITTNQQAIDNLDEEKLDKEEATQKFQSKVVSVDIVINPEEWDEETKTFVSENIFGTLGFVNNDDLVIWSGLSKTDDTYANTFKAEVSDVFSQDDSHTYVAFECQEIPTETIHFRVNLIKHNSIFGDMEGYLSVHDLDGETIEFRNGKVRVISASAVSSVNTQTGDVVLTASDIKATNQQTIQQNLERIDERVDRAELYKHSIYAVDDVEGVEFNLIIISPISTALNTANLLLQAFQEGKLIHVQGTYESNGTVEQVINVIAPTMASITMFGVASVIASTGIVACHVLTGNITDNCELLNPEVVQQ